MSKHAADPVADAEAKRDAMRSLHRFLLEPAEDSDTPLAAIYGSAGFRAESWTEIVHAAACVLEMHTKLAPYPELDTMIQSMKTPDVAAKSIPTITDILRTCSSRIMGEAVARISGGTVVYAEFFSCLMRAVDDRDKRALCTKKRVEKVRLQNPECKIEWVEANVFGGALLMSKPGADTGPLIQKWAEMPETPDGKPEQGAWCALMASTHAFVLCRGQLELFEDVRSESLDRVNADIQRAIALRTPEGDAQEIAMIASAISGLFALYWT